MLNASRAIARNVDLKIGWNRIGIVISLLIVSIAAATLYNLLRDIQVDKVVAALREKSLRTIVIASGFVAAGYVTLTFYDFFSLRTIGRDKVPYRIAALASFTSYSIGHNLGATTLTAGYNVATVSTINASTTRVNLVQPVSTYVVMVTAFGDATDAKVRAAKERANGARGTRFA